jgi:serine/threonine-protein kinase RsbT
MLSAATTRLIRPATPSWTSPSTTLTSPVESAWQVADGFSVAITSPLDVVSARERGRTIARAIGLSLVDQALVTSAISELTRNILRFASAGRLEMQIVRSGERTGLTLVAEDGGPGIPDIDRALTDGFSTAGGLGLGLPGVRRLMDEFGIESTVGRGTVVTVTKWSHAGERTAA